MATETGRSMRKREVKHYNDDNLAIAVALARAEAENKLLTKGSDHQAAKAALLSFGVRKLLPTCYSRS